MKVRFSVLPKFVVSLSVVSACFLFSGSLLSANAPTEHVVEIKGFQFIPDTLSVNVGDTVTWINRDIAPHTATANDSTFDTGELKFGESASVEVTSEKITTYFCQYHPMMKATVEIK